MKCDEEGSPLDTRDDAHTQVLGVGPLEFDPKRLLKNGVWMEKIQKEENFQIWEGKKIDKMWSWWWGCLAIAIERSECSMDALFSLFDLDLQLTLLSHHNTTVMRRGKARENIFELHENLIFHRRTLFSAETQFNQTKTSQMFA
jgi:hypothetical protein